MIFVWGQVWFPKCICCYICVTSAQLMEVINLLIFRSNRMEVWCRLTVCWLMPFTQVPSGERNGVWGVLREVLRCFVILSITVLMPIKYENVCVCVIVCAYTVKFWGRGQIIVYNASLKVRRVIPALGSPCSFPLPTTLWKWCTRTSDTVHYQIFVLILYCPTVCLCILLMCIKSLLERSPNCLKLEAVYGSHKWQRQTLSWQFSCSHTDFAFASCFTEAASSSHSDGSKEEWRQTLEQLSRGFYSPVTLLFAGVAAEFALGPINRPQSQGLLVSRFWNSILLLGFYHIMFFIRKRMFVQTLTVINNF